jgi:ketosteroid isomerase-like protein
MHELYGRWIEELWSGGPGMAGEVAAGDFAGHRTGGGSAAGGEMRRPGDDLLRVRDGRSAECRVASWAG